MVVAPALGGGMGNEDQVEGWTDAVDWWADGEDSPYLWYSEGARVVGVNDGNEIYDMYEGSHLESEICPRDDINDAK